MVLIHVQRNSCSPYGFFSMRFDQYQIPKYFPYLSLFNHYLQSNTFQAVIITDQINTFLMYNYPGGGIQWVVPFDQCVSK